MTKKSRKGHFRELNRTHGLADLSESLRLQQAMLRESVTIYPSSTPASGNNKAHKCGAYMKLLPAIRPGPVMSFVQAISDRHHLIAAIEKHRSVKNKQALRSA